MKRNPKAYTPLTRLLMPQEYQLGEKNSSGCVMKCVGVSFYRRDNIVQPLMCVVDQ